MNKFARHFLLLFALLIVGGIVAPMTAQAQPRHHRSYHRRSHHRPVRHSRGHRR